ncbi:LsmAD domain-containing protein [Pavlovales sp. CCMP2436]|nr:LsmAD domain-containing protein [Pavlovales sp. CCMP2436]
MATETQTQTPAARFTDVIANLVGRYVCILLANGGKYEGVLQTAELEAKDGAGFELWVVTKKGKLDELPSPVERSHRFALADIVRVDCKYSLHDDLVGARTVALNEVRADTEISTGAHGKERELQAWSGEGAAAAVSLDDWDHTSRKKQFAGWDQFSVNEDKFGVTTSYNENLYTTTLDRSAISKEAEAAAAKLAAEIEGTVATHALQAEERGQTLAGDDQYDEEARYSTVLQGDEKNAHMRVAPAADGAAFSAAAEQPAAAQLPASEAKAGAPAAAPSSKLNPNAKSFVMNINAPAFVMPGSGGMGAAEMGAMGMGMGAGMGARPIMMGPGMVAGVQPGPLGFGCGYAPAAMMAGFAGSPPLDRRSGDFIPGGPGGPAAMAMGANPYGQMLRPGAPGYVIGQQFIPGGSPPGHMQQMAGMAAGMAGMGVRGPPQYPMPPAPPGAQAMAPRMVPGMVQGMFPGGPQQVQQQMAYAEQMAAMRAMQPAAYAYAMAGGGQQMQQQLLQQQAPARFAANPPGFAVPQPPRNFQPRR